MTGVDPPLTNAEVWEWLDSLAPTDAKRLEAIREMLRNAIGDHMSAEDRTICVRMLKVLNRRVGNGD